MAEQLQIYAGVERPKRKSTGGGRKGTKYPFASMDVGHTFFAANTKQTAVRSAISVFTRKIEGDKPKFTVWDTAGDEFGQPGVAGSAVQRVK